MRTASNAHEIDVVELTADEEHANIDGECQRALGIGIEEFTRRWHSGYYQDCDDPRVTQVAMLLPDAW
ncbi:hypothetical protein [Actinoplanes sp. NPDC051411]|uniref:hypothetical protein n=1 Tax=Actinoplanes sp. NPDC051411 TaxID=3155522 RepID=UPI00342D8F3C